MEEFIPLNVEEYDLVNKFKKRLENRYKVKILLPTNKSSPCHDVVFGLLSGDRESVASVKRFIEKRMSASRYEEKPITVITLSDCEESSSTSFLEEELPRKISNNEYSPIFVELPVKEECIAGNVKAKDDGICGIENSVNSATDSSAIPDDSICIIESTVDPATEYSTIPDDSICIIVNSDNSSVIIDDSVCIVESSPDCLTTGNASNNESSVNSNNQQYKPFYPDIEVISPDDSIINSLPAPKNNSKEKKWYCRDITACRRVKGPFVHKKNQYHKVRQREVMLQSSGSDDPEICEVTSTTGEPDLKILPKNPDSLDKVLPPKRCGPAPDFIAINSKRKKMHSQAKTVKPTKRNFNQPVLEEKGKQPVLHRRLRPVVIDGSNVARLHGMVNDTFSSKGIQLCVDYFVSRGHTQVTAFVPNFRRHADKFKVFPTTDSEILEALAKKQHVVFTPSHAYDDRFMLKLAIENGGVIVTNDNFRDLLNENEKYREVIEKRLLQYCFVGDLFMVPDDPCGRKGPSLEDFLSFPSNDHPPK